MLRIGQLAAAAGVPTSTVRYYERAGLLKPASRSGGNYRCYDEASLHRLRFIRAAQASGFSLSDISTLLELTDDAHPCCDEVQTLIEHRLAEVRTKREELDRVHAVLARALAACRRGESRKACVVLQQLQSTASVPPAPRR